MMADRESDRELRAREAFLMRRLGPLEGWIVSLQGLLVWERPAHSMALLVVAHIVFLLAVTLRVFYVVGAVGVVIVLTDMWKNHIWPEIRLPSPSGEDSEDWTPVHPRLLSVPEICQLIAPLWLRTEQFLTSAVRLRQRNHTKFFVLAMSFFTCTGVLGLYIRGVTLAYLTMLFLLLFPCFLYHDGWRWLRQITEPLIAQFESTMRIRRTRRKSAKPDQRKTDVPGQRIPLVERATPSDSDSDDLAPFVPDTEMSALAVETMAGSEEEGADTASLLPPPTFPSQTTSREPSESDEENDTTMSLTPSLPKMPAYDDTLDGSLQVETPREGEEDEDLAPPAISDSSPSTDDAMAEDLKDEMQFDTRHFDEEGSDTDTHEINEEALAENLRFPELSQAVEDDDSFGGNLDVNRDTLASLQQVLGFKQDTFGSDPEVSTNLAECSDSEDPVRPCPDCAEASTVPSDGGVSGSPPADSLVQRGQELVSMLSGPAVRGTVSALVAKTGAGLGALRDSVVGRSNTSTATDDQAELIDDFEILDEAEFQDELEKNDDDPSQ